ncbi:MAG: hypothetical protein HY019_12630 [Aquabacterium sp.]|uniref:glycosyltransferase family 2 protein n=1 Tax=Aquabacterium sp. TaxID=1872578 RepID=UPI0025BC720A|nr:hypothetical protein [Aquabacterium sp.]MBI3382843.1 hypothetical protein [Aquabacterium sp.]
MIIKQLKTWNRRRLEARKRQKCGIPHLEIQVQELQNVLSPPNPTTAAQIAIGLLAQSASPAQIHASLQAIRQACLALSANSQGVIYIASTRTGDWLDEQLSPAPFQMRCVQIPDNTKRSTAENFLLKEAAATGFTHYISMSADGLPEPGAIKNLVQMSIAANDGALIEAVLFPDELPKYFNPQTLDTDWVSMTCLLIPAQIYQTIGGFDEDFHHLGADIDYSWRARSMGFKTKTCPTALYFQSPGSESRLEMACAIDKAQCASLLASKWQGPTKRKTGDAFDAQRSPEIASFKFENQYALNRW